MAVQGTNTITSLESSVTKIELRTRVVTEDLNAVRQIVTSSGFFDAEEIETAVWQVADKLQRGEKSEYQFVIAEVEGHGTGKIALGYLSFGRIALTAGSYDVYFMGVHNQFRGKGMGALLIKEVERLIQAQGGRKIYIETAGRAQYQPTRYFYGRQGYKIESVLKDFYSLGDDKITFSKTVSGPAVTMITADGNKAKGSATVQ